jgi:hypothetical protein
MVGVVDLVELTAVTDVYVDNVGAVEVIGDGQIVRVIYFTWQGTGAGRQAIVVAKIVMPVTAVNRGTITRMLAEQTHQAGESLDVAMH